MEKAAMDGLKKCGFDFKKGTSLDTLFFMSYAQAKKIAELIVAGEEDKGLYKNALKEMPAIDMALFGRMVTGNQSLSYDAAAQVAHSIMK